MHVFTHFFRDSDRAYYSVFSSSFIEYNALNQVRHYPVHSTFIGQAMQEAIQYVTLLDQDQFPDPIRLGAYWPCAALDLCYYCVITVIYISRKQEVLFLTT